MQTPELKNQITLSDQIRCVISTRIVFCVILLSIAVFISSGLDFFSAFEQTKTALNVRARSLNDYIVAQALINNTPAINAELKNTEHQLPGLTFTWIATKNKPISNKMQWIFPYHWQYDYPISDNDGIVYGEMRVSGSYFYNHTILKQLLIKFFLLFFFSLFIFTLLKPLSKKIPRQLFINPILDVLAILQNRSAVKNDPCLPYEFQDIQKKINELLEEVRNHSKIVTQEKIATQVAHDIRSPLLVLTHILNDLSSLPEKKRIDARHAIQRVTDIANNLLTKYKNKDQEAMQLVEPVVMMLESIVSEKRIQTSDTNIDIELDILPGTYNAFIQVDIAEFKRVISNLMNNAIDAVKNKKGIITISAGKLDGKIFISVKDNGCGIPKNKLKMALEEGATFGKKEGSGLGLPYAVKKISEWRGDYSLNSNPGEGTQFEIILSETRAAEWFSEKICVIENGVIVVLDDDNYIHQIWDERFPDHFLKKHNISLFHFNHPSDFIQFCDGKNFEKITFLLDYEIRKNKETGLFLAEKLNLGKYATLVTSRYEDNEIREKCKTLGMKIIPKYFADRTPICVLPSSSSQPTEIVFIDDNKTMTNLWKESAEDADIAISVFNHPQDFINTLNDYSKDTFIYIDSTLSENLKGEDIAKILYDQGYQNIILATGYPKRDFQHVTWVKDIIGKNPPWE